ncbi:MAG: hypothetical protein OHK0039_40810 [Bacteroidia bacterium]
MIGQQEADKFGGKYRTETNPTDMKTTRMIFTGRTCLLVLALWLVAACRTGDSSQTISLSDLPSLAPDRVSMIFHNDYVEVLEVNLRAGTLLPAFDDRAFLLYAIDEGVLQMQADKQEPEQRLARGDARWMPEGRYAISNDQSSATRFLIVLRKAPGLPGHIDEVPADFSETVADWATVPLDNEYLRVIDLRIPPSATTPATESRNGLLYALNTFQLRGPGPADEATQQVPPRAYAPGDIAWFDRGVQQFGNAGPAEAHFVIFAFKQ